MGETVKRAIREEDGLAARLLFSKIKQEVRRAVNRGRSFADAADSAGVDHQLLMSLKDEDEELAFLWETSKDRDRQISTVPELAKIVVPDDPIDIKHKYLRDLAEAGLFHKSVEMVRRADVNDEVGARVIEGHLRYVAKELWPKESNSKQEIEDGQNVTKMSVEDLETALENKRRKRLEAQARIVSAKKALEERAGGKSETA